MTTQFDKNLEPDSDQYSPWNPFVPTKRDVKRTEELAKKNPMIAGILTFLFPFAGMVYLNRGANGFKIFGYTLIIGLSILGNLSDSMTDEELEGVKDFVRLSSLVALTAESVRTVSLARKRLALK